MPNRNKPPLNYITYLGLHKLSPLPRSHPYRFLGFPFSALIPPAHFGEIAQ